MKKIILVAFATLCIILTGCGKKTAEDYAKEMAELNTETLQALKDGDIKKMEDLEKRFAALQAEIDERLANDPEFAKAYEQAFDKQFNLDDLNVEGLDFEGLLEEVDGIGEPDALDWDEYGFVEEGDDNSDMD